MSPSRTLLVIPHYRDVRRIEPFLKDLVSTLPPTFSILISDDGSPAEDVAELRQLIQRLAAPFILEPLIADKNRGKGAAVYAGWRAGLKMDVECLAFADADGAVSASEILRAHRSWTERTTPPDVLIGSRMAIAGRTVERRWIRHVGGRVFAGLVSCITGLPIYDTQCGFKMLKREAFEAVEPDVEATGFAFDVELLMLLQRRGFRLEEFPVDWRDVRHGKVSLVREAIPMLIEVCHARSRVEAIRERS